MYYFYTQFQNGNAYLVQVERCGNMVCDIDDAEKEARRMLNEYPGNDAPFTIKEATLEDVVDNFCFIENIALFPGDKMYAFYFQVQFHKGRTYIIRVHTNYTDRHAVQNKAIKLVVEKWKCTEYDFVIRKVSLSSLLSLLSFTDNVAQFGE